MAFTEQDARKVEACLLEGGMVQGRDFNAVFCTQGGESVMIAHPPGFERTSRQLRTMWRAFSLVGLTDLPLHEWLSGEGVDA